MLNSSEFSHVERVIRDTLVRPGSLSIYTSFWFFITYIFQSRYQCFGYLWKFTSYLSMYVMSRRPFLPMFHIRPPTSINSISRSIRKLLNVYPVNFHFPYWFGCCFTVTWIIYTAREHFQIRLHFRLGRVVGEAENIVLLPRSILIIISCRKDCFRGSWNEQTSPVK